ncbi:MAG TPA: Mut7-C RNAse domain-containing protein [Acidobacteriota bacterium]|nr:Mut7-C RNAse domain-containing protein [Acidobacteriota bacterium]HQM63891.1 Mut7-C RNAse domain-containing protein [Acidobacteriota bacterium]
MHTDHSRPEHHAEFRFYEELNDFLPPARQKRDFTYTFHGRPAVKDAIEALGVPHPEVDLILVNGESVDFGHPLGDGDRVSVYPVFESLDIAGATRLRPRPLREPRFILDVHLGRLARHLRLLGFDTRYANDAADAAIAAAAARERRIVLTRDRGLLKHGAVTRGYWVRTTAPRAQAAEVIRRFQLEARLHPFTRCLECNGVLRPVDKAAVANRLPSCARRLHDNFAECPGCRRLYWPGSHHRRLAEFVTQLREKVEG